MGESITVKSRTGADSLTATEIDSPLLEQADSSISAMSEQASVLALNTLKMLPPLRLCRLCLLVSDRTTNTTMMLIDCVAPLHRADSRRESE